MRTPPPDDAVAGEEIVPPDPVADDELLDVPGQVVVRIGRAADEDDGGEVAAAPGLLDALPVLGETPLVADVPSRTGDPDLDAALDDIGATALWRVHAPGRGAGDPARGGGIASEDELPELADLVLVELAPGRGNEQAIDRLRRSARVLDVSPSGRFTIAVVPDDPSFPSQWGLVDTGCPAAWDVTQGDASVVVAVVDTGCDLDHPDLAAQYEPAGVNVIAPEQAPDDEHGHGTHVAGIVAAAGDNGTDVAGVAWHVRLVPVKALDRAGRAVGSSIAQGIGAAAPVCTVMNLSLQGATDDLALRSAMDVARRLGVVVVAAMGNLGWDETRPSYPAASARTYGNVLAVGAVDRQHRRSVWSPTTSSNTGSWIGIAAPGTNIDSTARGGAVTRKSGTSQACPHVAGAAALVRSVAPALTPEQVIGVLTSTARPLRDDPLQPVPNAVYGSGLLDVAAAVTAAVTAAGGGVADVGGGTTDDVTDTDTDDTDTDDTGTADAGTAVAEDPCRAPADAVVTSTQAVTAQ